MLGIEVEVAISINKRIFNVALCNSSINKQFMSFLRFRQKCFHISNSFSVAQAVECWRLKRQGHGFDSQGQLIRM